jgi:hypothetical protein
MSQPDLIAQLREARRVAPPELRERVRLIAVEATVQPRRRITWRRAAVVLVPVAAAIVAAVVLLPRGGKQAAPISRIEHPSVKGSVGNGAVKAPSSQYAHGIPGAPSNGATGAVPAPSSTRLQRYSASLELRLASPRAISNATKRATQIVALLGGYPSSLNVHTGSSPAYANLVLRVPRVHAQEAVRRLAALGTILNEDVSIQDLQAQANATDDLIARLQRQLAALRALPSTTQTDRQIAAVTAHVDRLQRTQAATIRTAYYATIDLQLTTRTPARPVVHEGHGPLHGLGIVFHWAWIGAVYALAVGTPLAALIAASWLLARALRRRREDKLLAR